MLVSLLAGFVALVTLVEDAIGGVSVGEELVGPPLQGLLEPEAAGGYKAEKQADWKP